MSNNLKFVIGIGSQRAGSTLLHKILEECTSIFMHPVKELHFYDTLFNVRKEEFLKEYSKRELSRLNHEVNTKKEECQLRTNQILSDTNIQDVDYFDLYRPCILGNPVLGEITPEYMVLPEVGIEKMRDDLGEDAKIILIARDPVERFISSVKLLKLYGNKQFDMQDFEDELLKVMDEMPTWIEQQDQLNDYESTLNKYSKYFSKILFLSYEDIVSNPWKAHKHLEEFLELKLDKEKYQDLFNKKINSIGETGYISSETRDMLRKRYQKSIQFLNNNFTRS